MPVDGLDRFFNPPLHLRRFSTTPFQAFLDGLLFTGALLDSLGVGLGPPRQILERGQNALKFRIKIFLAKLGQIFQRQFQDVAVGPGRDWENVIEISERKRAAIETDPELASLEHAAVLIARIGSSTLSCRSLLSGRQSISK